MEINASFNLGPVGRPSPNKPAAPQPPAVKSSDAADFSDTAALDNALQNVPDVRSDVVERAKRVVIEANYPPPETIRKISHLLALKLSGD